MADPASAPTHGSDTIEVSAIPVTRVLLYTSNNSSSNSGSLVIKAKVKINIIRLSSDHNNNNNNAVVRNKYRVAKFSGTFTVSQQRLISDDGRPASDSWNCISDIIARISYAIPFSLNRVRWVDSQIPTGGILLETRDELVTQTLEAARAIANRLSMRSDTWPRTNLHLHLSIKRNIFLNHDVFVSRLHHFELQNRAQDIIYWRISLLEPSFELEAARREIIEYLRTAGVALERHGNLRSLTDRLLLQAARRESPQPRTTPAGEDAINSLDIFIFDDLDEECSVCKNILVRGDHVVQLPCFHVYHSDCARRWLRCSNLCPLCRYALPTQP